MFPAQGSNVSTGDNLPRGSNVSTGGGGGPQFLVQGSSLRGNNGPLTTSMALSRPNCCSLYGPDVTSQGHEKGYSCVPDRLAGLTRRVSLFILLGTIGNRELEGGRLHDLDVHLLVSSNTTTQQEESHQRPPQTTRYGTLAHLSGSSLSKYGSTFVDVRRRVLDVSSFPVRISFPDRNVSLGTRPTKNGCFSSSDSLLTTSSSHFPASDVAVESLPYLLCTGFGRVWTLLRLVGPALEASRPDCPTGRLGGQGILDVALETASSTACSPRG